MTGHADRDWREVAAFAYLDALDAGDLDALAALWERAAIDPELEDFLRDLGEGLHEVEGPGEDFESQAGRVRTLAFRHIPGFVPDEPPAGPITAGEVARRLQVDEELGRRLDPTDRGANSSLVAREEPLPEPLRMSSLAGWGRGLGVVAGPRYWSAFHKVAVMLRMARSQSAGHLAAARRSDPKPRAPGGTP
jgi:hypothetical protein